ncbi:MAG: hypothetical protein MSG64_18580 [Pyrinomonadaceae bacterium MAG19_C2-C3]|nr:hypothetical protein [Pyrinomonadaceae bacterium MAG19_C2-C3]
MKKRFAAILMMLMTTFFVISRSNEFAVGRGGRAASFMIGVVRADGMIIPFAEYARGAWSNPWTEAKPDYQVGSEVVPKSLGMAKAWFERKGKTPRQWYFRAAGDEAVLLTASKIAKVENHSQDNWALESDLPKQANESGHHRNLGIALSGKEKFDTFIEIKADSKEAENFADQLKPLYESAERLEIARSDRGYTHGVEIVTDAERAKVKLEIQSLYRSRIAFDGRELYSFGVKKSYARPPASSDAGCADVAEFQGWAFRGRDGELSLLDGELAFNLTDCDGKTAGRSVTPFGTIRLDNQTFLIVEEHGWEDESYTILELKDSAILRTLETHGG